jgi:NAD(P)-dependent dehydrogenase (short-subunit alcohol dehydrogenase family)
MLAAGTGEHPRPAQRGSGAAVARPVERALGPERRARERAVVGCDERRGDDAQSLLRGGAPRDSQGGDQRDDEHRPTVGAVRPTPTRAVLRHLQDGAGAAQRTAALRGSACGGSGSSRRGRGDPAVGPCRIVIAMAGWSTRDMPDQRGAVVLVTGASSGIGLVTARELARAGARTILACRNELKARRVADDVRAAAPDADVELVALDLASLASVERCAADLAARFERIDVLVNNAGVMAPPLLRTEDGFELQFGTNHLGHFALTARLMPLLEAAEAPRVVTVASSAHRIGRMRFDDLNWERAYRKWPAYGQSKLANLLFHFELQRRAQLAGSPLLAAAAHPGYAATHLQAAGPELAGSALMVRLTDVGNRLFAQSDEQGALPTLYAATTGVPPGAYVGPDGPIEMRGSPTLVGTTAAARDRAAQERLWEASRALTGVEPVFAGAPQRV